MKNFKIINEFHRIKELGFIKSNRKHNTGIGKTFEDYLGVAENNLKDSDFEGFEIKSQRFLSDSKVTLFTKSPSFPKRANNYIRDKYGEFDETFPDKKFIHSSFYANRYNTYLDKYGFKIHMKENERKMYLLIKDLKKNIILENEIYYKFDDIEKSIKKLNKLFVVTAETKTIRDLEHFHYTKAEVFINFKSDLFWDYIKNGIIQYDIRIGIYKSGKKIGTQHDHGSGFRINRGKLPELFENSFKI